MTKTKQITINKANTDKMNCADWHFAMKSFEDAYNTAKGSEHLNDFLEELMHQAQEAFYASKATSERDSLLKLVELADPTDSVYSDKAIAEANSLVNNVAA